MCIMHVSWCVRQTDDTTNAAHIPKRPAQHKHVEMYTVNMYSHAAGAHVLMGSLCTCSL